MLRLRKRYRRRGRSESGLRPRSITSAPWVERLPTADVVGREAKKLTTPILDRVLLRTPKSKTRSAAEPADERRERELLRGMLAGDDGSFETVMVLHGAQVTRLARRYLCNEADAAECVQDTFLKVFQNIASFERRSSLWTWIRRIAINECLMRLRQIKRRAEEDIEELLPVFDESGSRVESSGEAGGIVQTLYAEDIKRTVHEAIDQLPGQYRTVLLLRDIDDYNTSETAAILGIKENAVKVRLHRARSALKQLLAPLLTDMKRSPRDGVPYSSRIAKTV